MRRCCHVCFDLLNESNAKTTDIFIQSLLDNFLIFFISMFFLIEPVTIITNDGRNIVVSVVLAALKA